MAIKLKFFLQRKKLTLLEWAASKGLTRAEQLYDLAADHRMEASEEDVKLLSAQMSLKKKTEVAINKKHLSESMIETKAPIKTTRVRKKKTKSEVTNKSSEIMTCE